MIIAAGAKGFISIINGKEAITQNEQLYPIPNYFQGSTNTILDFDYTNEPNLICIGTGDLTVQYVDIEKFKTVSTHMKHQGTVKRICNTQKGILSGSQDGLVCCWDKSQQEPVFTLPLKHQPSVTSLLSPTDDLFFTADSKSGVIVWDFRTVKEVCKVPYPTSDSHIGIAAMALSPNGKMLGSIATNNTVYFHSLDGEWNYAAQSCPKISSFYNRCCFSPCSKYFVTGSTNFSLNVFFAGESQEGPIQLLGHAGESTCVEWCKSSFDYILSCSDDKTVQIWKTEYDPINDDPIPEHTPYIKSFQQEKQNKLLQHKKTYTLHYFTQKTDRNTNE